MARFSMATHPNLVRDYAGDWLRCSVCHDHVHASFMTPELMYKSYAEHLHLKPAETETDNSYVEMAIR